MHLYQSSLEGHESREEAKWARVPTLFLGQTEAGQEKLSPPPAPYLLPCTYFYAEFFYPLHYLL